MKYFDTLLLSIKNLFRHKLRTILTIVGVAIGTCALLIMQSLGQTMDDNMIKQISQMGNIMQIQIYNWNEGGKTAEGNTIEPLDDNKINEIAKLPGVEGATPIMDLFLKIAAGKYVCSTQILGIKPDMFALLDIPIQSGRGLLAEDTDQMVVGGYVSQNFYDPKAMPYRWEPAPPGFNLMEEKVTLSWDMNYGEKPVKGQPKPKVKVKPVNVEVVGIVAQSGGEFDYSIVMPIETVKKYKKEQDKFNKQNSGGNGGMGGGMAVKYGGMGGGTTMKGYNRAIVKAKDMDSVLPVLEAIKAMGYEAYSPIQMLEDVRKQYSGVRQILAAIGAMAFIIAFINIINTLYMSIYERTREIGIIKVIGARLLDIMKLYLLEAGWIGILGGAAGVGLSFLAALALNHFNVNIGGQIMWMPMGEEKLPSCVIPPHLPFLAVAFSFGASLLAGLLPAFRAMRLSVMKALRQD